jgi:hypothetical protein
LPVNLIVLLALFLPQIEPADGWSRIPFTALSLPETIRLTEVHTTELAGKTSIAVNDLRVAPIGLPEVVREIPELWALAGDNEADAIALLDRISVEVRVYAASGAADRLSSVIDSASEIKVRIDVLQPRSKINYLGKRVSTGGVRLILDSSKAFVSGPYEGVLEVTVQQL